MSFFERKLDGILAEMAMLGGWNPTDKHLYQINVTVDGTPDALEYESGSSPRDAIDTYLSRTEVADRAARAYGLTPEQFRAALTAKAAPPAEAAEMNAFASRDTKSISSEKTRRQIEQWLNANNTPYNWVFYFGDVRPQPTPGAITFIKYGNAGGDTLTPHMILHTIGHAVGAVGADAYWIDEAETKISALLGQVLKLPKVPRDTSYVYGDEAGRVAALKASETKAKNEQAVLVGLSKLLHMKAAEFTIAGKGRGFPNMQEAIFELIAIYIKNGRIKVEPNRYCDFQISPKICAAIKLYLETKIKETLDRLVGSIISDD